MQDISPEDARDLKIAGELIDAGIPVFAAAPNPDKPGEYFLPPKWQATVPSRVWLERWKPGWALGAVGGHQADFLDFDPRNGGAESRRELEIQGQMPRSFGTQETPSGGTHEVISLTGEAKGAFMPGVDLQSGKEDGHGRGFVYIAPTVRPSKAPETMGQLRRYRWVTEPDLGYLAEFERGSDDTLDGIIARVHAKRSTPVERNAFTEAASGDPLFGGRQEGPRLFTMAEAQAFCLPYLEALEGARIGEIEESANTAAAALYHFVGSHWDADTAFAVLMEALGKTAYDPDHQASGWDASKFMPVLDGRRAPLDGWKAELRMTHEEAASAPVEDDAVEALLAEMLTEDQLIERPAPQYLIKGLLNLDSEAWTIGEPGCKKSFVVLDQAAHIVRGQEWRGRKVTQGPVVIIAAEGAGGMSTRVKAYRQEYGPIGAGFRMLPRPVQASNAGAWRVLAEACKRLGAVMVVVDTQARVTVGLKENDATDMGIYVEAVRILREATGACVNTIHHTGRNGGDARGSSAIDGAQGTELKVVKTGAYTGVLKVEKQKDMEEAADIPLSFKRVVVGQDADGDEITSLVLVAENAFANAEGTETPIDPGQVTRLREPEAWTHALIDHNKQELQRQILQAVRELTTDAVGLSEAKIREAIVSRWYGGKMGRKAGELDKQSWNKAWPAACSILAPDGEAVITRNSETAPVRLNQMFRETLPALSD